MRGRNRPVAMGHEASAMAAQRWAEVRAAAEAALALAPEVRAEFLDQACGADSALRAEVEAQVDACERAARLDGVLGAPAAEFAAPILADLAAQDGPGAPTRRADLGDALRSALPPHYTVERELGRGGMATVYLARDLRHDRTVAVKVLDRNVASAGAERFLHEIRIAARLTHPHVLGVHDSGEANGLLYYVMPYVEGETLRARLAREGALSVADAIRVIRELADALAHAHARGVMHRDLKPENVLLSGGHAVVADFGIAKAIAVATQDGTGSGAGLTSAGVALGTPAYMAPEQAIGDPGTDQRADLYALGVVAYEVLTGTRPFGGRTPQALVKAHLTESPVPLGERRPDAPPALAAMVMGLLAKDATERPQRAEDVLRVLDGIPGPLTDAATAYSTATAARSRARRLVPVVAAVLLLVAGAIGYVAWRGASAGDGRPGEAPRGRAVADGPVALRTVAVLPFVNTGGVVADDYFSDGMTDELAHALARIPGVRLAGRTSSYMFKGKAVGAQEIGRALGVGALVSGTVRRAGGRLRVTAQLVSAADGTVLWDSVYESRSGDVFAVQDEVTRAVVAALRPALGDRGGAGATRAAHAERGTTDAEAYELYLKGRYYWLERGRANVESSIGYHRQAVARDPSFARAHAGLAMAYGVLPVYDADPTDSATALVVASARRALALDSTLADAQVALGQAFARELRLREAEARYRAALAVEPSNVSARQGLGLLLLTLGRTDEALVELRHAAQLDPLAKSVATAHGLALIFARRFPEAVAAERRAFALDSTFPLAFWGLGLAQTLGGQSDSAVRTLERGLQVHPETPGQYSALVLAYATAGRWADAERVRARLRRPGGDPSGGAMAAFAELVFGDREPLVRLLTTAAGQRSWIDAEGALGCNPLLDPLWADTRFRAAMRRLSVDVCPLARPWPVPPRSGG